MNCTYIEAPLHHDRKVELPSWELPLGDHNHVTDSAGRARLLRHQVLLQHLARDFAGYRGPV